MADVTLHGVGKVFESRGGSITALTGVDLAVRENEFVAIVGASGCGKSTLLNLVAGFEQATAGAVQVGGVPVKRPGPDRGVVFQQSALFPWLTVRQNVAFGLELAANKARKPRGPGVDAILKRVGLTRFANHYPSQLSGGMRQRAALARALANDPEILLMDEPFAAVDAMTRQLLQDQLVDIVAKTKKTVIFVTHSIDEALILSDRITVFSSRPGRVKAILENDLPKPRSASAQLTPRYLELKSRIWDSVQEEVLQQIALMERIQR